MESQPAAVIERGVVIGGGPSTRTVLGDAIRALLVIMVLGLALRLTVVFLLPGSGNYWDINLFRAWADNLAGVGLYGFYGRDFFHAYPPPADEGPLGQAAYMYVLYLVGVVGNLVGSGPGDLIKIPPIVADIGLAWVIWSMVRELGGGDRAALLGAGIAVANPISWFDSAVWGQVDSVGVLVMLLALRELWRDRPERSAALTVLAVLMKPQLAILVPVVAVVTIRRAFWPAGGYGDEDPPDRRSMTSFERRVTGPVRIATTALAGLVTAVIVALPFGLSVQDLIAQVIRLGGAFAYLSLNAYNPWALVSLNGSGMAANGNLIRDNWNVGPLPAVMVGAGLFVIVAAVVALRIARRPERRTMLVGMVVLCLAFYLLPTRVHERYLYPLVAFGTILAAVSPRWRLVYGLTSVVMFANVYGVLTANKSNPGIRDWLGIGPAFVSYPGYAIGVIALTAVFVWAFMQLREGALARLRAEVIQDVGFRVGLPSPIQVTKWPLAGLRVFWSMFATSATSILRGSEIEPKREEAVRVEDPQPLQAAGVADASLLRQHLVLIAALALAPLAVILQVSGLLEGHPGFYQDESSFAYNAHTIATAGVDEHGIAWPVYFRAFGDFKSAPFIYLLAGVFKVVGPSILAAELLAAMLGLVAALGLGWLANRITKRPVIGLLITATALLTPHLFEISRLAFEVSLIPAELVLFLLVLQSSPADKRWSWVRVIALGLALALLAYSYTAMRLLAALLGFGLVLYAGKSTWPNVARTWGVLLVALIPMAIYAQENPTFLFQRLDETSYLKGSTLPDIVARFANRYLVDLDPRNLLLVGDANMRHHVAGVGGPILVATLILAIIGLDRIVHRFSADPWWRYVAFGLLVAVVPAALTVDDSHANRLLAVPVFLILLGIPALKWLLEPGVRGFIRQGVAVGLVAATLVQGAYFQMRFHDVAPGRAGWFDGEFPRLFDEAVGTGADPIYLADGIAETYIHAYWYGVLANVPTTRFVHLTGGEKAPPGALVISSEADCGACQVIDAGGFFKIYRVP
ncbi:MAG TPA: hypothetical protein VEX41_01360 [Candidatus Eisenbacteria bacterium]|nr:hypothetical protein [Candidatus Eisenbacteria bacterium]